MKITIQSTNEIEDVRDITKLIWDKYQKGFLIYLLLLTICSAILIYFGLKDGYTFQSSFDIDGNFNSRDCENYFYNFDLTLGMGISILFLIFLMLLVLIKQKIRFEKQKKSKLAIIENKTERIIDDEYYEFTSAVSTRKHQWKVFESYKELDNYILLNNYKKSNFHIEYINLDKLNSEQKLELYQLFNSNNIEKE